MCDVTATNVLTHNCKAAVQNLNSLGIELTHLDSLADFGVWRVDGLDGRLGIVDGEGRLGIVQDTSVIVSRSQVVNLGSFFQLDEVSACRYQPHY